MMRQHYSAFRAAQRWAAISVCLLLLTLAGTPARAAEPDDVAARLKALEERVQQLEAELAALKSAQAQTPAAQSNPAAPAAPATPAVAQAAQASVPTAGTSTTSGQLPVYSNLSSLTKVFNPDISVIGDFIGAVGRDPVRPIPTLAMHESELGLQAIIDPYARGDFFLSFGEEGVNLEEGYITFTALPAGFLVKAGKMRSAFGKVNTLHNHVLPWIDRPLVTDNLLGGEDGINDAGFSVSHLIPAPKDIYLDFTGQVFRGDSADVFHSNRRSDVMLLGHLKGYRDINESTNLELGTSFARGHNDFGTDFLTDLYGFDATLRWKPLRRSIYHSFIARSELAWSRRQDPIGTQRAFGWYGSADYQLARRWFLGGRYDWSERAVNAALHDSGGSLVLTYWPSEFSQLRAQYKHTNYAEGRSGNELRFQLIFALGAHGAHPF